MKKLQQKATSETANQNAENAKPTLSVVGTEATETKTGSEPNSDQSGAAEQTPNENLKPTLTIVGAEPQSNPYPFAGQNPGTQPQTNYAPISIEKRLQAVDELYRKTGILAQYKAKYEEHLQFEIDQNEGADIETESFATCSLRFTDSKGRTLTVKSGAYLRECHEICKAKYKAIIEKLEDEIRWPYTNAA